MRIDADTIIYAYLFICAALMVFNLFYIFRAKARKEKQRSRVDGWRREIAAQFTIASGNASRTMRWTASASDKSHDTLLTPRSGGSAFFPHTATTLCPAAEAALTKLYPTSPVAPVQSINIIRLFYKNICACKY